MIERFIDWINLRRYQNSLLHPARFSTESFEAYRRRRRLAQRVVKRYLKGRLAHKSVVWVTKEKTKGITYNVGRNADKRRRREISKSYG